MGQLMRQTGVVIGLTLILTFPVTVISGAGSQKHPDHAVRFVAGVKGYGAMAGAKTEGPASPAISSPRQGER